ncbi:MAG: S9 family peptidase [Planctomycetota bacterium]
MLACWTIALACLLPVAGEEAGSSHPFCFNDMIGMARISDANVSPDGAWVAYVSREYSLEKNGSNADIRMVTADGYHDHALTNSSAQDWSPRWLADGKRIAFLSTRSGSPQIWTIRPDGGEAEQVTDLPVGLGNLSVSPDGSRYAFSADVYPGKTMRETADLDKKKADDPVQARSYTTLLFRHWDTWEDGKRSHVFVLPVAGGEPLDLMQDADADCPTLPFGGGEEIAWSPAGDELCLTIKQVENAAWSTDVDLYVTSVSGGGLRCITEENEAWDTTPVYSPDGSSIAYLAMKRPGYEADRFGIVIHDRSSGKKRRVADDWDRSCGSLAWAADGETLYVTAGENARDAIFSVDLKSGKVMPLVTQHSNSSLQVASTGRLIFCQDSMTSPAEVWSSGPTGSHVKRLTDVNGARVAAARMSEPQDFWFEGAGGDRVHSWLLKPVDFKEGQKYPLALMVHGGPQGAWNDHFHYRWNPQIYAGAGYVVLGINFHGSTSFGQEFCDSIRGDWGGKPFEDIMKGVDRALETYRFIDPDRMGAIGASYGGYQINWMAGHTDRFKAFVCHDGNLDERAAYFMTEEPWFPEWDHMGVPWENPESYEKHNPVNFVQNWKTPMLVIHGALDYRVVDTSGMASFTALQRLGIPSKLLYFPDENHWVLKPRNSQLWHQEVVAWLDQWVKDAGQ